MPFLRDLQIQDLEGVKLFLRIRRQLDQLDDGEGTYGIYGMYIRVNSDPVDVKTHFQSSEKGFYRVYRIPLEPNEIEEWKFHQRRSLLDEFVKGKFDELMRKEKEEICAR